MTRRNKNEKLEGRYCSPALLQRAVEEAGCPADISDWLGRLRLLYGVPVNYLVPDEALLPPESIRFFTIDPNWIEALVDGALSSARNLAARVETVPFRLEKAALPSLQEHVHCSLGNIRSRFLGTARVAVDGDTVISGFLLRSFLVRNYPGLGVIPYGKSGEETIPLEILRMEALGPDSDTLICLVAGDMRQMELYEAPEALHYGIDRISPASKTVYPFKREEGRITMDTDRPLDLDISACMRNGGKERIVEMKRLSELIGQQQSPALKRLDAAEMGFEMTEGVGLVRFIRKSGKK